jgi:hypothetical protein
MFLISELAIGFPDAPSGSALIRKHGLSSLAPVYEDFDGESGAASNPLDANGRVVRYVDEVVDVTVLDVDGAIVTSFTPAACATSVAVRHDMFNGTSTDGRIEVGGLTTLDGVLTKLQNSLGGGVDGDVVVNGVSSSISDALAASSSVSVFNVLTYGAIGNGTTDDSAAINAAVSAASALPGGTVYFPPGYTYLCNTSSISVSTSPIRLSGGGDGSVIKSTGAATTTLQVSVASGDGVVEISGLKFIAGASNASSAYSILVTGTVCPVRISGCSFVNNTTAGTAKTGTYAVYVVSTGPGSTMTGCYVSGMRILMTPATNIMSVSGCSFRDVQFRNSSANIAGSRFLQTTNAHHGFFLNSSSTESVAVSGCSFVGNYSTTPITSASLAFNGSFCSQGNRYMGCVPLDTGISYTSALGYIDSVRDSAVATYTSTGATDTYTPSQQFGRHVIYATGNSVTTVSFSSILSSYPGAKFDIFADSATASSHTLVLGTTGFSANVHTYTVNGQATAQTIRTLGFSNTLPTLGGKGNRIVLESDSGTSAIL